MNLMKITIKAPAKINLFLEVKSKRADGFHELEMIMQKLDFADLLIIEKVFLPPGDRGERDFLPGFELTCSDPKIPADERNLVWKAWQLLVADFPEKFVGPASAGPGSNSAQASGLTGLDAAANSQARPLTRIHIKKRIPQQAGLAGGSSDAASALMGLNQLYQLGLSRDDLCHYGQKLGSDVNFFFYGPSCLVKGRGEIIQEIPSLPALPLVLVKPKKGLSAARVYSKLTLPQEDKLISLPDLTDFPINFQPFNRLEEPAFKILPDLETIKNDLLAQNPQSLMSGSGTTFFSLFNQKKEAEKFFRAKRNKYKFAVLTAFAQNSTYKEDSQ